MRINIGKIFIDIVKALIDFGSKFAEIMSAKVNITSFLELLNKLGIDITQIPNEIGILAIIGTFGGVAILGLYVYKLIK